MTAFLAILAVWRASLLITEDEEGPFGLFSWVRDHIDPYQKTWLGRGIRCLWCVSWWAGCVLAGWLWYFGVIQGWELPLWWFGTSAGAIYLQNMATKRR